MRRAVIESVLVVLLAIVLVPMALGTIELQGLPPTWAARTYQLMKAAVTADFVSDSGLMRIESVPVETLRRSLVSARLVGLSLFAVLAIAIPLGIQCTTNPDDRVVRLTRRLLDAASSLPLLLWSTALYVVMARAFDVPPNAEYHAMLATLCAVISLVLGDRLLADLTQGVEIAARETLQEPYMRTVRAGGFGVSRHLLQALVAPVATAVLSRAMYLVGGAIVVEFVFNFRGLGDLVIQGLGKDVKVALAAALMLMVFGVAFRLLHRMAVQLADARPQR